MNKMESYIMVHDESRSDNGCPGYIKYVNPDGRLVVQIYASTDMDSFGTQHYLNPEQVVSITRYVFQKMLSKYSKARRDAHDYMQKDSEFTVRIHRQFQFAPKKIIYNDAATIVYWNDGTKTVVKCNENDEYSEYFGFIAAVAKKMYGGTSPINQIIKRNKTYQKSKKKRKSFEEILDKAAKECDKLPSDLLEHPELHSR